MIWAKQSGKSVLRQEISEHIVLITDFYGGVGVGEKMIQSRDRRRTMAPTVKCFLLFKFALLRIASQFFQKAKISDSSSHINERLFNKTITRQLQSMVTVVQWLENPRNERKVMGSRLSESINRNRKEEYLGKT